MCVHEQTKDRISITAQLGKQFGTRVFNAMLVPHMINRATSFRQLGGSSSAPKRLYVICLLNHTADDELDALLEGTKSVSGGMNETMKYSNFDPKT